MNISNKLKNKVINHEKLNEQESEKFIKYIISKAQIITKYKYNSKTNNPMYLLNEICYSYNLIDKPYINLTDNHIILLLSQKKYLINLNFNNGKIPKLKENKYIEYTDNIYKEYLKLTERR